MKERPILFNAEMVRAIRDGRKTQTRRVIKPQPIRDYAELVSRCPYGAPGDKRWVRETWRDDSFDWEWGTRQQIAYRADGDNGDHTWRPSIHMPRWASRITLEVTGAGAERVQDITPEDVVAEGVSLDGLCDYPAWIFSNAIYEQFRELWDSPNAKRGYGWDSNPWVWVLEFERGLSEDVLEAVVH